jgi:hypothetical protein
MLSDWPQTNETVLFGYAVVLEHEFGLRKLARPFGFGFASSAAASADSLKAARRA